MQRVEGCVFFSVVALQFFGAARLKKVRPPLLNLALSTSTPLFTHTSVKTHTYSREPHKSGERGSAAVFKYFENLHTPPQNTHYWLPRSLPLVRAHDVNSQPSMDRALTCPSERTARFTWRGWSFIVDKVSSISLRT